MITYNNKIMYRTMAAASAQTMENKKEGRSGYFSLEHPSSKRRRLPTLPHCIAVPSAMTGLTSLFGMGRGEHRRYHHQKSLFCS